MTPCIICTIVGLNGEKASGFNVNVKNKPGSMFNPDKYSSSFHRLLHTLINAMNRRQL